ncbi:helix-turn-helix transcriptional regulator [Spirillospora sp. NPDC052242]
MGHTLNVGHGLGGKVASIRRPIVVNYYVRTPQITHAYDRIIQAEGLRAMAAVPVVVAERTVAVVFGAYRGDQLIGGRIYDAVVGEARTLEPALVAAATIDAADEPCTDEALRDENRRLRASARNAHTRLRLLAARTSDPDMRAELLREAARLTVRDATAAPAGLTDRESDVLALVSAGLTNAQIATALGLTTYTVKSYMKTLMAKLGARTRHEAVVISRRRGHLP